MGEKELHGPPAFNSFLKKASGPHENMNYGATVLGIAIFVGGMAFVEFLHWLERKTDPSATK